MLIIDGRALAEEVKNEIVNSINYQMQRRPHLAIILIGERPDSVTYVKLKEKAAKSVGIDTSLYKIDIDTSQNELEEVIRFLNKDDTVDGILLQLPLPSHLDTERLVDLIDSHKDIDGLNKKNIKKLNKNVDNKIIPPVYAAIFTVLSAAHYDIFNRQVLIIGNSQAFTQPLASMLQKIGAKTTIIKIDDQNFKQKLIEADLIITAVGKPHLIKKGMVKKGSSIIDIGICRDENNQVHGDADWQELSKDCSFITPVPGGIGPLTVAFALKNTLEIFQRKIKNQQKNTNKK